ncbi:ammonium transporter [Nonomuraea sp. NPDC050556]|uniref:ammonium transporter n=1 Tax=Nonomuraea sp. NPDC050556 TaxID=3364369 RepID=UPI00379ACA1D
MIDSGTTAWMLVCTALVLLMTPGLAFFYGGMTRAKSVLNMMMMSFVSIIVVTVAWVFYGYSLAFDTAGDGTGIVNKIVGGLDYVGLSGVVNAVYENLIVEGNGVDKVAASADNFPLMVFSAFQLTFAVITVALISGAIADRAKFGAWVLFSLVWATVVYFPVAHWVWGGGWLGQLGIEDFAGGTVVHINAGAAALALALVLGKRKGWRKEPMRPHNLTLVLLGTGLLWFGWFGFNAGSELAADQTAGLAFMNTQIATAVAAGAWMLVEKLRDGHATTLGVASGAVAGLVAITPACGFVDPWAAVVIGLLAGVGCAYAVGIKYRLGFDDSLDVVGVHLVGGVIGAVSLGFVAAYPFLPGQNKGILLEGGQLSQLGLQVLGPIAVGGYSFVMSWIIGKIIDKTMGFRIAEEAEVTGIDITAHAETGYDLGSVHASGMVSPNGPVAAAKKVDA